MRNRWSRRNRHELLQDFELLQSDNTITEFETYRSSNKHSSIVLVPSRVQAASSLNPKPTRISGRYACSDTGWLPIAKFKLSSRFPTRLVTEEMHRQKACGRVSDRILALSRIYEHKLGKSFGSPRVWVTETEVASQCETRIPRAGKLQVCQELTDADGRLQLQASTSSTMFRLRWTGRRSSTTLILHHELSQSVND
ncbi:hypothetical protein BDV96DRAFT_276065 [Lophiotrema nucula]|uniref:Uncharacterized protein n=1 Tax=Lophiotrema nucula TaxID=690887 RepID=A0A6A5ZP69_9PLEO|nr:hypothetical protein BDV96DRAFT_276065 [Lophiotrema nucula]